MYMQGYMEIILGSVCLCSDQLYTPAWFVRGESGNLGTAGIVHLAPPEHSLRIITVGCHVWDIQPLPFAQVNLYRGCLSSLLCSVPPSPTFLLSGHQLVDSLRAYFFVFIFYLIQMHVAVLFFHIHPSTLQF